MTEGPMGWNHVRSQANADALLDAFGHFHDACVREAHLFGRHWVNENLSMACPANLDQSIRLLVQRQCSAPSAIELLFDELTRFNLVPAKEDFIGLILQATLLVRGDQILWAPYGSWTPESADAENDTWISARRLRWRIVDWMGEELRYGPRDDSLG